MSRSIGITDAVTATAFRAVGEHTTRAGNTQKRYAGLYDKAAHARAVVTRELGIWARHLGDIPEETVTFDAWVEPVTVINHPGVRYTNDWTPPANDVADRLGAISALASASEDGPENPWAVAYATRRLADGDFTVAQARERLGEEWGDL